MIDLLTAMLMAIDVPTGDATLVAVILLLVVVVIGADRLAARET